MDLAYSITYKVTQKVVDEREDETSAVALHGIPKEAIIDDEEGKYVVVSCSLSFG